MHAYKRICDFASALAALFFTLPSSRELDRLRGAPRAFVRRRGVGFTVDHCPGDDLRAGIAGTIDDAGDVPELVASSPARGTTYRVATTCPHCRKAFELASSPAGGPPPGTGAIIMCIECGGIAVLADDGATKIELADIVDRELRREVQKAKVAWALERSLSGGAK